MATTLENMQEIGFHIENERSAFARIVTETSVYVRRSYTVDESGKERPGPFLVGFTVFSARTGETLGLIEQKYSTLDSLMDALGVDDVDEIWQMLD